eukprot:1161220-Pelagomonas_calceolata.AAC.27
MRHTPRLLLHLHLQQWCKCAASAWFSLQAPLLLIQPICPCRQEIRQGQFKNIYVPTRPAICPSAKKGCTAQSRSECLESQPWPRWDSLSGPSNTENTW